MSEQKPAELKPTIYETHIVRLAEHAAQNAFQSISRTTNIEQTTALEVCKDAGDKFAANLTLSLKEAQVVILPAAFNHRTPDCNCVRFYDYSPHHKNCPRVGIKEK